jgi:hypothetical protein
MTELVFMEDADEEAPKRRGQRVSPEESTPETQQTRRIRVQSPFRVCHNGVAYSPDEIAEVPADLADDWLLYRWVEPVE